MKKIILLRWGIEDLIASEDGASDLFKNDLVIVKRIEENVRINDFYIPRSYSQQLETINNKIMQWIHGY